MSPTVLYIEDDPDTIRLVERLLRRRPQTTLHVATTGRDGLAAAVHHRPDLILLDNHLPDATGGDLLRQLASATETAGIPIVIVSGDAARTTADGLVAAGATELLAKPFDIHAFMDMLDRHLDGRPDPHSPVA